MATCTGEFFISLASYRENAERQLSLASCTSEFLLRRLDEGERTLSTLQSRVGESYGSLPALQNVATDFTYLCNRVSFLRSHFKQLQFMSSTTQCSGRNTENSGNIVPARSAVPV